MIEDLVSDVRCDPEPRHSGHAGAAQVMKDPTLDAGQRVEPSLHLVEALIRTCGVGEDVDPSPIWVIEDRNGLFRQVHDMETTILGARCRQRPNPSIEINLVPGNLVDFFTPLTGEGEELDDPAKRPTNFARSLDDLCEFLVVENTIAGDFAIPGLDTESGRRLKNRSTEAPAKEALDALKQPMSRIGRALRRNLKHQRADVPALDVVNASMAPYGDHFTTQLAANGSTRPNRREMLCGERLDQIINPICHFSSALFEFLGRFVGNYRNDRDAKST